MRMRKKKGLALLLVAALLTGLLSVGTAPVSKAEETSAPAGKYGLKNPVVKAVSPPENTSHGLSNPRNENGTVTWDCVEFGSYWQNDTNGDGVADKNDEKEPIKWRVLSVDGDDAFLLADTNLDVQRYNDTREDVTWETCTMRSWLNGYGADENVCGTDYSDNNFLDNAFTESEQVAIKDTVVVNEDNPEYGTEGGNDTMDKVYLLSLSEVMNPMYGFASITNSTETREAVNTTYVAAGGEIKSSSMYNVGSMDRWWLRSPGDTGIVISCVCGDGEVWQSGEGKCDVGGSAVSGDEDAVRPALHLNLSDTLSWSYGGIASSDGGEIVSTWDCIWFGSYWQNDTDGDGTADKRDEKEPIKWRVLLVNGDDVFLVTDTNLDVQKYNDTKADVTWEMCTMRTWLNGDFLNNAFSASEQIAIQNTTVFNEDNLYYGTEGGNDTTDKVYLLSLSEVMNPSYGFASSTHSSATRESVNTAYVAAGGETKTAHMNSAGRTDSWRLRSPGNVSSMASAVSFDGCIYILWEYSIRTIGWIANPVDNYYTTVRPVLHLNLSDSLCQVNVGNYLIFLNDICNPNF